MSIARHHAEWLSLLEISGPFLSMPVLLRAFPQGLDALDLDAVRTLRLAYEEWRDSQGGLSKTRFRGKPNPAIHTAWIRFVLERVLELPPEAITEGQAIPPSLKAVIAEQGETLRPDLVIVNPSGGAARLLIQSYPPTQDLDKSLPDKRWKASPATRMMELLRATGARLGLATNGERWMLVVSSALGGETTGFISWYAEYWLDEPLTLRAFRSLLGAPRFFGVSDDETLEALLAASAMDQHEVTDQLGYQVRRAVEVLVQAIDRADQDRGRRLLVATSEAALYEAALTVMMRLVFLFSAEERGLLLLGDPLYDQHYAVSTLRAQLREAADQHGEEVLERRLDAWCRLLATFRGLYGGIQHDRLTLPAYGGSLFDPDRFPFLEGRRMNEEGGKDADDIQPSAFIPQPLPINNRVVLHLLEALQMLRVKVPGGGPAEARRLSFRALDVEQIGHVYEGLLDHTAVRASEPVVGLAGTKDKEPEIPLAELERFKTQDSKSKDEAMIEFLREETGRSESALKRALTDNSSRDTRHSSHLRAASGNDESLYHRVLPFAGLIRGDDFDYPVVIPAGSVYVTAGTDRRSTGTHYTPRSLTEPIVQHTLEPLVYVGPVEGWPKEQWKLRPAAELLELKICDLAMGSGGFLVQTDRYLAERLVEAWEAAEATLTPAPLSLQGRGAGGEGGPRPRITPEGKPSTGAPGETLIPLDPDERMAFARRIVADRCLYGVDKNPLAVEMAKLSLWLITLAKDKPFTFLDHALKCGDSLVGADEEMFERWAHGLKRSEMTLFDQTLREHLQAARARRRELESFEVKDVRDAGRKAALLAEADAAMARVKLGCDLLIGVRLLDLKPKEKEARLNTLLLEYMGKETPDSPEAKEALAAAPRVHAFHWPFEFPEVFERGGFSAFVGNPPFVGGRRIRETLGDHYRDALYELYSDSSGNADYCAFFFLRGFRHLRRDGTLGLIATNTIAQGDTRQTGLDNIVAVGGTIYNAVNNMAWPGAAAVSVSVIHVSNGRMQSPFVLDDQPVPHISSMLDSRQSIGQPYVLAANNGKSFQGSVVVGEGFVLSPNVAKTLIEKDQKNRDVLLPYLNGEDVNSNPDQSPSRWVINFFDWPLEKAETYTGPMAIVREKVYPVRVKVNREAHRKYWWHYGDKRPALYRAITPLRRVLVAVQTSKYLSIGFQPRGIVYSHSTIVFVLNTGADFALLSSSFHEVWVRKYASTLETRLRYIPTDCFETFPFPADLSSLEPIGEQYHEHRRQIMLARQEGLTQTYNRFHDPDERSDDITGLRELHVEMDKAVARAYGSDDLDLGHGFHKTAQGVRFTLSEAARREVLARLLKLNHERYEEEQKAVASRPKVEDKKGRRGEKRKGMKKMGGEEEAEQLGLV